ncbi:MAG: helix-turn-helix domain-containing protein [Rhodospirillales bacterium]
MSSLDAKTIKSAERVLHVLEYFDSKRTKATVMEIARQLGYPQSSTSELLRCLVKLGYLNYDRFRRTYEPTARVPLLGAWVQPGLFRHGHLLPMLDEISRATGETVTLSSLVGLEVHYIHVVPAARHRRTDGDAGRHAAAAALLHRPPVFVRLPGSARARTRAPAQCRGAGA